MPSYDYLCEVANEEFEEFHSITIVLEDCPLCKKAGRSPHAPKRLISGGSGRGIVELSGQELMQQIKSDSLKMKKDIFTSEKKLANIIGESTYHRNETERNRR